MSEPEPVLVTPQRVLCPNHGEHLRAQWPKGFAVVSMMLFRAAVGRDPEKEDGTLLEACGWEPGKEVPVERINEVTARRPLCYFVTRKDIREALMESEIGKIGRCDVCDNSGIGGPYQVGYPQGRVEEWVCFSCALDGGERLHRAHPSGGVWPTSQ